MTSGFHVACSETGRYDNIELIDRGTTLACDMAIVWPYHSHGPLAIKSVETNPGENTAVGLCVVMTRAVWPALLFVIFDQQRKSEFGNPPGRNVPAEFAS